MTAERRSARRPLASDIRGRTLRLTAVSLTLALLAAACGGTQLDVSDQAGGGQAADGLGATDTTAGTGADAGAVPGTVQQPDQPAVNAGTTPTAPSGATVCGDQAALSDTGQAAPPEPADTGQQQPPADTGQQQPPADSGQQQPPADSGQQQPPADSGQEQPPATGDNGGATDIGVSAEQIKLGSISGVNTPLGNIVAAPVTTAVIAAMRAVNDGGGVHGRFLDIVDCDDAGDVTRFRSCYRKLVEQDEIFAFITSITWGTGEVHGDLARDEIPWVGSWGFYTSEHKDPWMFPVHLASIHEANANAKWVRDVLSPETVGILFLNSPEQHIAREAIREVLEPAGIEIVREIPQEISTADESGNVLSMRGADPDHIIHFSWPPPIVKFMVDSAAQGYWPPQGMSGNHFLGEVIGDLVGEWPLQNMWTISSYEIWGDEYLASVEKYAPQMRERHHHITQSGFIGVKVFGDAAREVGPNLNREDLMTVLESREWDAGPGLGQTFLWSPGNHDNLRCEYMFKYNSADTGSLQVYVPAPEQYEICADA